MPVFIDYFSFFIFFRIAGSGDGLYYQANGETDWTLRALWFEQKDFN